MGPPLGRLLAMAAAFRSASLPCEPDEPGSGDEGGLGEGAGAARRQMDEDLWEAQELAYEQRYLQGNAGAADEGGRAAAGTGDEARRKRRRAMLGTTTRAAAGGGLIRYMLVGVDFSGAMGERDADYRHPSKVGQVLTSLEKFLLAFGDANPLSHFGFVVARNGLATKVHEMSPDRHLQCMKLRQSLLASGSLDDAPPPTADGFADAPPRAAGCYGDFSLQNVLACALSALGAAPAWGRRECVVVASALASCDPGDLNAMVEKCHKARIRVSIVGLSAEVFAFRRACQRTGGTYAVARNAEHLADLLQRHVPPPPADADTAEAAPRLVRMGFPRLTRPGPGASAFVVGKEGMLHAGPYHTCPRCKGRTTGGALPQTCQVCGLFLASAAHLARTYHHLNPLPPYVEEASGGKAQEARCFGCCVPLASAALVCPKCRNRFCFDCDQLARDSLHECCGCLLL